MNLSCIYIVLSGNILNQCRINNISNFLGIHIQWLISIKKLGIFCFKKGKRINTTGYYQIFWDCINSICQLSFINNIRIQYTISHKVNLLRSHIKSSRHSSSRKIKFCIKLCLSYNILRIGTIINTNNFLGIHVQTCCCRSKCMNLSCIYIVLSGNILNQCRINYISNFLGIHIQSGGC